MLELWGLVGLIPVGRVTSYGELGRLLETPASGYFVGRWMAQCPPDVPWWRVVSKTGHLPVHKRDPKIANEQVERLGLEGVPVVDGRVDMREFAFDWDTVLP